MAVVFSKKISHLSAVGIACSSLFACGIEFKSTKVDKPAPSEGQVSSAEQNNLENLDGTSAAEEGSLSFDLSSIQIDSMSLSDPASAVDAPSSAAPPPPPNPGHSDHASPRVLPFETGYVVTVTVDGLSNVRNFPYPTGAITLDKLKAGMATVKIELVHRGQTIKSGETKVSIIAGQKATAVISLSRETTGSLSIIVKDQASERDQVCAQPMSCASSSDRPLKTYGCEVNLSDRIFRKTFNSHCALTDFRLELCRSNLPFSAADFDRARCFDIGAAPSETPQPPIGNFKEQFCRSRGPLPVCSLPAGRTPSTFLCSIRLETEPYERSLIQREAGFCTPRESFISGLCASNTPFTQRDLETISCRENDAAAPTTPVAPGATPVAPTTPVAPGPTPVAPTTPVAPRPTPVAPTTPVAPRPTPVAPTTPMAPRPTPVAPSPTAVPQPTPAAR